MSRIKTVLRGLNIFKCKMAVTGNFKYGEIFFKGRIGHCRVGGVTGSSAAIDVFRSKDSSPAVRRESWEGAFGVISSYAAMQQLTGSALKCTPCIPESSIQDSYVLLYFYSRKLRAHVTAAEPHDFVFIL
jgi:hypothetical protein